MAAGTIEVDETTRRALQDALAALGVVLEALPEGGSGEGSGVLEKAQELRASLAKLGAKRAKPPARQDDDEDDDESAEGRIEKALLGLSAARHRLAKAEGIPAADRAAASERIEQADRLLKVELAHQFGGGTAAAVAKRADAIARRDPEVVSSMR